MNDAFQAKGDVSLVENFSNDTAETVKNPVSTVAPIQAVAHDDAVVGAPNGFIALGLAPELINAVKDLGFTRPTAVQLKTIPLAMQGQSLAGDAAHFTDLMVSSQTGSGKTAAFLLPMLHTLLTQQAQAEAKERADFQRAAADLS